MDEIRLAANLKAISKRISIRRLAKESGVSQSSISSWQHGQLPSGEAGYNNLRKICKYLGCDIETLMHGDITKEKSPSIPLSDLLNNEVFEGKFIVELKVKRIKD